MKKSLIVALALVFVLGIAGTAFAAANPFSGVPQKHWAYDAVNTLAKAGIVEGWSGKYWGDKAMTRYEMAQIVARAMARSDKADKAMKATIDKLAVEFAAELQSLGVRVAKLEANQPNLKFMGDFKTRYTSATPAFPALTAPNMFGFAGKAEYRLRLDAVAKVDDNSSFAMRFVTREPNKYELGNNTWQTFGANTQDTKTAAVADKTTTIDRINWTTKVGDSKMTVGRQSLKIDGLDILMDSGAFSYDGVKFVAPTGDFTFTVNYGRFLKGATMYEKVAAGSPSTCTWGGSTGPLSDLDVASVGVASKAGKLAYNLQYFELNNPVQNKKIFKWTIANATWMFENKLSLGYQYAVNNGVGLNGSGADKNMYAFKAIYGDQVINKEGAKNINLLFGRTGANSMWNGFSSMNSSSGGNYDQAVNYKFYDLQYAYGFSKSFNVTLDYVRILPQFNVYTFNSTMWRGVAQVLF